MPADFTHAEIPLYLSDIMYFGGKDINLWYRGGHGGPTLMATIERMNYNLDDEGDSKVLCDWADALRTDSKAQPVTK